MKKQEQEQMDIQAQWEEELIRRIDNIEKEAVAVKIMTKKDYIVAAMVTVVCLVAVICGAFLG